LDEVTGPSDSVYGPNFTSSLAEGTLAQQGLITPCGGMFTLLVRGITAPNVTGDPSLCRSPGAASWTVKFSSAGTQVYVLSFTPTAAFLTLSDLFLASLNVQGLDYKISFSQVLALGDAFSKIPAFQTAVTCLNAFKFGPFCIADATKEFFTNPDELAQLKAAVVTVLGVSGKILVLKLLPKAIRGLAGPALKGEDIAAAFVYYQTYTTLFSDNPGYITIKVTAN
jgi:hypothetical protein